MVNKKTIRLLLSSPVLHVTLYDPPNFCLHAFDFGATLLCV